MKKLLVGSVVLSVLLLSGCGKKHENKGEELKENISEHVENAKDQVSQKAEDVKDKVTDSVKESANSVKDQVSQKVEEVKEKVEPKKEAKEDENMKPLSSVIGLKSGESKAAETNKEDSESKKVVAEAGSKEKETSNKDADSVEVKEVSKEEIKLLSPEDELKRANLYKEILELRAKIAAQRVEVSKKELDYTNLINKAK